MNWFKVKFGICVTKSKQFKCLFTIDSNGNRNENKKRNKCKFLNKDKFTNETYDSRIEFNLIAFEWKKAWIK